MRYCITLCHRGTTRFSINCLAAKTVNTSVYPGEHTLGKCGMSDRWPVRLSPLSVVLLPAGLLAWTILAYGVNVPFWDQWVVGGLVVQAFDGTLSLRDLVAQQNESRLVFPRLLFLGLAYLTGYDVRYEMWGSFCLACLVVYNVYRLGQLTLGGPRGRQVLPL